MIIFIYLSCLFDSIMSLDEKVVRKPMTDKEFIEELDRNIRNGTANIDLSLGNFEGTPEQAAAQFVRDMYFDKCGDYNPPRCDETIRYH